MDTRLISEQDDAIIQADLKIILPDFINFMEDVLELFMNSNPEVCKIFSWADDNLTGTEQRSSPKFQRHAKAIGATLEKCLANLNGIDVYESELSGLGTLHNSRRVQYQLYEKMGLCIVENASKRVGANWTQAHKDAWIKAYEIVTYYMIVRFWEDSL